MPFEFTHANASAKTEPLIEGIGKFDLSQSGISGLSGMELSLELQLFSVASKYTSMLALPTMIDKQTNKNFHRPTFTNNTVLDSQVKVQS